jgi:hypothetical protein
MLATGPLADKSSTKPWVNDIIRAVATLAFLLQRRSSMALKLAPEGIAAGGAPPPRWRPNAPAVVPAW